MKYAWMTAKAVAFMVLGSALTLGYLAWSGFHHPGAAAALEAQRAAEPAAVAPVSRDQFTAAVYDKSPQEVLQAVGRPDDTAKSGPTMYWFYLGRTYDPVTSKADYKVQVVFESGISVTAVNYY